MAQYVAAELRGRRPVLPHIALLPLIFTEEQTQFETACRLTSTSSSATQTSGNSIQIFLRMLLESVGMDWIALRYSLQRLGLPNEATPAEYVRQLVPIVGQLQLDSSSQHKQQSPLSPHAVALLFLLAF